MVKVFILTFWIVFTNACDPQERNIMLSTKGNKYLIHSFDQSYFALRGSSNFTIKHLLEHLNFTSEEPTYPFIVSTSTFETLARKSFFRDGFCEADTNFQSIILSVPNYQDQQNHSLLFYGCNLHGKHDVSILILKTSNKSFAMSESFWKNLSDINRNYSSQFCKCDECWKYVHYCLNGDNIDNDAEIIYIILYLLSTFGFISALIIVVFMLITRVNKVGIAN